MHGAKRKNSWTAVTCLRRILDSRRKRSRRMRRRNENSTGKQSAALLLKARRGGNRQGSSGRDLHQGFRIAQAHKPDVLRSWRECSHGSKREFHTRCVTKTHYQLLRTL